MEIDSFSISEVLTARGCGISERFEGWFVSKMAAMIDERKRNSEREAVAGWGDE